MTASDMDFGANAMENEKGKIKQQQISTALEHLAMAATTDKSSLSGLLNTNAELVGLLSQKDTVIHEKDKLLTSLYGQISKLNQQLVACKVGGGGGRVATPPKVQDDMVYNQNGYCWSHGFKVMSNPTSATCKKKKDGHKEAATRNNHMGGKLYNSYFGATLTTPIG